MALLIIINCSLSYTHNSSASVWREFLQRSYARQHLHQTRTFLLKGSKLKPTEAVFPKPVLFELENYTSLAASFSDITGLQLNAAGLMASKWRGPGPPPAPEELGL